MKGIEGFEKGNNNPNWKNGVSKSVNYCVVCKNETSDYRSTRCSLCYIVILSKRRKSSRQDHPFCKMCGKECPRTYSIFCSHSCHVLGQTGSFSHFWKGGVTPENILVRTSAAYKEWRLAVFKRDNWACQFCNVRSSKNNWVEIHADHIKPFAFFPELRLDVSNGRTLCKDCHKKTETFARNRMTQENSAGRFV